MIFLKAFLKMKPFNFQQDLQKSFDIFLRRTHKTRVIYIFLIFHNKNSIWSYHSTDYWLMYLHYFLRLV